MKKLSLLLVLLLPFSVQAGKFKKVVGQTFPEVKVKDLLSGKTLDLSSKLKEEKVKGAVVVFSSYVCPVARAYEERLTKLVEQYGDEFVFVILNANSAKENAQQWVAHAKEAGLKGHIAMDDGSAIAKKIGAGVTPEVYLLDKNSRILYHGPVDDSQDPKYIENHFLSDALKAVSTGKEIPEDKREAQAFGCTIKFAE